MQLDVLKAGDVANMLGCALSTVEERARSGDLPGLKFGDGGWVFPASALAFRLQELALAEAEARRAPRSRKAVLHPPAPVAGKRRPPALPCI
jgi:hypothetical protein